MSEARFDSRKKGGEDNYELHFMMALRKGEAGVETLKIPKLVRLENVSAPQDPKGKNSTKIVDNVVALGLPPTTHKSSTSSSDILVSPPTFMQETLTEMTKLEADVKQLESKLVKSLPTQLQDSNTYVYYYVGAIPICSIFIFLCTRHRNRNKRSPKLVKKF